MALLNGSLINKSDLFEFDWRKNVDRREFEKSPLEGEKKCSAIYHEEPHKVPLLITLSDGCYAQFPVIILPPISCRLAGVRLAVIDRDFHRGDETILNRNCLVIWLKQY